MLKYIIVVLIFVVIFQILSYWNIKDKISMLETSLDGDLQYDAANKRIAINEKDSKIAIKIKNNISTYLSSSIEPSLDIIESITDWEINPICEAIESKLSLPLYLGLMGTVAGIIITLLFTEWQQAAGNVNNILTELMKEIAPAMAATFIGVFITYKITQKYADAKELHTARRNTFSFSIIKYVISAGNSIRQSFNPSTSMAKQMADKQILILEEFNKSMSGFAALTQGLDRLQAYTDETQNMLQKFDTAVNSIKESESVFINLSGEVNRIACDFKNEIEAVIKASQGNITKAFADLSHTIIDECNIQEIAEKIKTSVEAFVQNEKEALKQAEVAGSLKELPQLLKNLEGLKDNVKQHTDSNNKLTTSINELSNASNTMVEKFPTIEGNLAHSEAMLKWLKISAALSGAVAVLLAVLIAVNIMPLSKKAEAVSNPQQIITQVKEAEVADSKPAPKTGNAKVGKK